MRLYPDPLIALIVEKKGVGAVRRVSAFQSVTVSVTILDSDMIFIQIYV